MSAAERHCRRQVAFAYEFVIAVMFKTKLTNSLSLPFPLPPLFSSFLQSLDQLQEVSAILLPYRFPSHTVTDRLNTVCVALWSAGMKRVSENYINGLSWFLFRPKMWFRNEE